MNGIFGPRLLDSMAFAALTQLSSAQLLSLDITAPFARVEASSSIELFPIESETKGFTGYFVSQPFTLRRSQQRRPANQLPSLDFITEADLTCPPLFDIDWVALKSQMPKAVDRGWDLDLVNRWRHKCVWFGWVSRF